MSPPLQGSFDASQFSPEQGMGKHPVGKKFPALIRMTSCEGVKDKPNNGYLAVVFETPAGTIQKTYNLWNDSTQAVEIAQKQLSALCHATGIFKLDWPNEGAALRGGQLMIDVDFQRGQEPTAEKPAGGYVEVSHVYDRNGNEPGKPPQNAPQTQGGGQWGGQPQQQPQSQQAPITEQLGGTWGSQPNTNAGGGWSQNPPQGVNQAAPWKK